MIIFKKQYEKSSEISTAIDGELSAMLDEARALIERAGKGVVSERSPITLVEKVQISDTVKLVKKLIIDVTKDIEKGRDTTKNADKLKKASKALRTSIDNIL